MSPCRAHIAHSLTDNYFVVSSTVGNVGLCNPAHLIGLWLECMACTLGDCSITSSIKLLNTKAAIQARIYITEADTRAAMYSRSRKEIFP